MRDFFDFIEKIISGEETQKPFSKEKIKKYIHIMDSFCFLYSYPQDGYFGDFNIIEKAIRENKFFYKQYVKNSLSYNRFLIGKGGILKSIKKGQSLRGEWQKHNEHYYINREYELLGDDIVEYVCLEARKNEKKGFLCAIDIYGNLVENKNLSPQLVEKFIRNVSAHNNIYKYQVGKDFYGKLFISKDGSRESTYKALIIPEKILQFINTINYKNHSKNRKNFSFIHIFKTKDVIKNQFKFEKVFDFSNIINIAFLDPANENKVNTVINEAFINFDNQSKITDIKVYLKKELEKEFKNFEIQTNKIGNRFFLEKWIENNQYFYTLKNIDLQRKILHFMVNSVYGAEILSKDFSLEKKVVFRLKNEGVLYITALLKKAIKNIKTTNQEKEIIRAYKNEVYIVLCFFIAYANLVDNNFVENYDQRKEWADLRQANISNDILSNENMGRFSIYDGNKLGRDKERKVEDFYDKQNCLRSIRNGICHSIIFLQPDASYDYKEAFLLFRNEKKKNLFTKVKSKDLLEFLLRGSFECKQHKSEIIVPNFEELIREVKIEIEKK